MNLHLFGTDSRSRPCGCRDHLVAGRWLLLLRCPLHARELELGR